MNRNPDTPAANDAAPTPAPASAKVSRLRLVRNTGPAARHRLKLPPDDTRAIRRCVAFVSGALCALFLALAIACVVLERSLLPLPFGTGVLVEALQSPAVKSLWTGVYWLAALNHLAFASVAALFCIAVTVAHTEMPDGGNSPLVLVYRRRSRYVGFELICAAVLVASALALRRADLTILAGLVESPGIVLLLRAAAILWVPIAREWLMLVVSLKDGIASFGSIGGGWRGLLHGPETFGHEDLLSYEVRPGLFELLGGYGNLHLGITRNRDPATLQRRRLRAFVSLQSAALFMNTVYAWQVARSRETLKSNMAGGFSEWNPVRPNT